MEYKLPRTDDTERRLQGEAVRYSAKAFVHSHDELDTRSTGFIASLLKLPAIQEISGRFEASRIVESEDDSSGEDEVIPSDKNLKGLNSSSSPLTSLNLTVYALSPEDLGHILRARTALRTLSSNVCSPSYIDFPEVRHALGPQKNYLESLSLDCDEARQPDSEIYGLHGIIYQFQEPRGL